jgi:DNA-binding MarR family transcriptional regulator
MELALKLDQAPRRFGTDQNLSHTEIHLVEMVGNNEGASVTDIASLTGVTKGAISQNMKRLEKKGIILKKIDPDNLSRNMIELTAKGKTAFWAHRDWHESMDGGFSEYLNKLPSQDTALIVDFLSRVENFLVRRLAALE